MVSQCEWAPSIFSLCLSILILVLPSVAKLHGLETISLLGKATKQMVRVVRRRCGGATDCTERYRVGTGNHIQSCPASVEKKYFREHLFPDLSRPGQREVWYKRARIP